MVMEKNRYIDQWNNIGNPNVNAFNHGLLVLTTDAKNHIREKTAYSTNSTEKCGCLDMQNTEIKLLSLRTKINCK